MLNMPLKHFARYSEILTVLFRHGLGYLVLDPTPSHSPANLALVGAHLREAFSELGPAFIKIGQLASTRSDILPQAIVQELAKLQDQVHPLALGDVRQVIEESLQRHLELIFKEFDPRPLAAASIGQVHQAVLSCGEKVVVKVQRPHIREVVQTDLEIFGALVTQFKQRTEWGRRFPVQAIFDEFSKTLWQELDFLNEGRNAEQIAQNSERRQITVPKIYWEYSRSSVLTMEQINGVPLSQIIAEHELPDCVISTDLPRIADQLSRELLRQVLVDGCFHGDPHPGNVLIGPTGEIALIDFGITGSLSQDMRYQLMSLIKAFTRLKDKEILNILSQMGIVPEDIDRSSFQKDMAALRAKHMNQSLTQINLGVTIQDFFNLVFRYGIYIPSELALIGKSLLTLEGVLKVLDPTLSLVEQAKSFSRRLIWQKYNPGKLLREMMS